MMILATKLLTRHVFAPIWVKVLIFYTFYFILVQMHSFENFFTISECMPRKEYKIPLVSSTDEKGPLDQMVDELDARRSELVKVIRAAKRSGITDAIMACAEQKNGTPVAQNPRQVLIEEYMEAQLELKDIATPKEGPYGINISPFTRSIIDKNLIFLAKKQENIEKFLRNYGLPEIAESKTRFNEIKESIEDRTYTNFVEFKFRTEHNFMYMENNFLRQNTVIENRFNEIKGQLESLQTQNQQLQSVITAQVAETKSQQEFIENMQKTFKRKLQEKDLMFNELRQENQNLQSQLKILERKINDLVANRYPGAQTTNPFTALRK